MLYLSSKFAAENLKKNMSKTKHEAKNILGNSYEVAVMIGTRLCDIISDGIDAFLGFESSPDSKSAVINNNKNINL